jgi:hypothetical protein
MGKLVVQIRGTSGSGKTWVMKAGNSIYWLLAVCHVSVWALPAVQPFREQSSRARSLRGGEQRL